MPLILWGNKFSSFLVSVVWEALNFFLDSKGGRVVLLFYSTRNQISGSQRLNLLCEINSIVFDVDVKEETFLHFSGILIKDKIVKCKLSCWKTFCH